MQSIILQLKKQISFFDDDSSIKSDNSSENNETVNEKKPVFHDVFQLPITYLDKTKIHSLSPTVCSDLELVRSQSDIHPMYDILFQPTHLFAKELIPYWSNQYTSDIKYLEDTKEVIQTIPTYRENLNTANTYERMSEWGRKLSDCDLSQEDNNKVMEIWKAIKEDEGFMERYSFIDWNMFKYLNNSSSFLQIFSMAQICSPLFSLILPFLFFLVPFFILKAKGVNITFRSYIDVLLKITKGHFIGNILLQFMQPISLEKVMYVLFFGAFYGFQIYQNIKSCQRFHLIVTRLNDHLLELKKFIGNSLNKMENFTKMHSNKQSYAEFCITTQKYCANLKCLYDELVDIDPFSYNYKKAATIGYMLKCYYRIYSIEEYGNALKYSMGFEGYIDNLFGVWENLHSGNVSYAEYCEKPKTKKHFTKFVEQYYPAHLGQNPVSNSCSLDKNMIISAPNAAGKTTLLKSTAINIVFTQQVGCGFYKSAVLVPYTHIHSYLNIPDTSGRDSLFQAESRRCKEIIDMVSSPENQNARHFAILDELYSGTNPTEAGKSAYAFLKYLAKYENIDFILTTHYLYVCKKFKKSSKIKNFKMGVEPTDTNGGYRFTYKLEKGISKIQGAMKILKDMNYPQEMLDNIQACG